MSSPRHDRPILSLIEENVTPFGVSLYIGGREAASSMDLLRETGITTLVNCAVNLDINLVPPAEASQEPGGVPYGHGPLRYYKIGLIDGFGNPATLMLAGYYILRSAMIQEMPDKASYPHRAHGNVLVNCRGGRSRSTALVALFLHRSMPERYPSIDAALDHVRTRRQLHPDEWDTAPKPVLVDAVRQASDWIDMIGHDAPSRRPMASA